jgi:hypothetical protein
MTASFLVPVLLLAAGAYLPGHPAATGPGAEVGLANTAIPAFSRQYRTSCSTCHVTPGKLNTQGEAFRLNGYRFPDEADELRQDDPVPLGAEPWKELWPGAIWPGEVPGSLPLSVHLANDLNVARRGDGRLGATYLFPAMVNLQAATALGASVAVFAEVAYRHGVGVQVGEAKVLIQDPLPWLPPRALNVWIGAQRPNLFTLGALTLDRSARLPFLWQWFRMADWELAQPTGGEPLVSDNTLRPAAVRPSIEWNGLAAGRFYYAAGAAQSGGAPGAPDGGVRDVYVKLRQKVGGMGLDGRVRRGAEPGAWGGQLLGRGLTLEQFAYFGEFTLPDGTADAHRSLGVAGRAVLDRADAGLGYVRGRNAAPWGGSGPAARHTSTFVRGEFLVYPWAIASVKAETLEYRASPAGGTAVRYAPLRRHRLLPGAVFLLRHNVRVIAEGEIFLRDEPGSGPGGRSPHALWLRLDVAY